MLIFLLTVRHDIDGSYVIEMNICARDYKWKAADSVLSSTIHVFMPPVPNCQALWVLFPLLASGNYRKLFCIQILEHDFLHGISCLNSHH